MSCTRQKTFIRKNTVIRRWLWSVIAIVSILLLRSVDSYAQDISASLSADSSHIVIGDFLDVTLTVSAPTEVNVTIPSVKDTVGNMEVVNISKIDTSVNGNRTSFRQTYVLSAYDSGIYHAGPQAIIIKNTTGVTDTIFADPFMVTVSTVPVDTSKAIKPINAPIEVPYQLNEFLPVIGGGALLVALLIAVIYYIRRLRKKKPERIERPRPKDPAHVWARKELKKLEEEKLWQKDEIKGYYSQLTFIIRMYLEYRYNWLALESTTEKISDEIDAYAISDEAKKQLMRILKEADLVKFAKRIPSPDLNNKVMEESYRFIELTEPKEVSVEEKADVQ